MLSVADKPYMLSVANKPFIIMMNVVILNVVMLNVIMLNVIMLNVVMLNVVMLNAIMLNVVMLNVVLPLAKLKNFSRTNTLAYPALVTKKKLNNFHIRLHQQEWGIRHWN
jgi:hypothetical protein